MFPYQGGYIGPLWCLAPVVLASMGVFWDEGEKEQEERLDEEGTEGEG